MRNLKTAVVALACATVVVLFAPANQPVMAAGGAAGEIQKVDPSVHFHAKGKPPSEHTLKVLQKARDTMPFDDTRDFDEARKGFTAPLNSMIVEADAVHIAWDVER